MNEIRPYVMRCPSCRKRNRIPAEKIGLTAKCGNCGERLATDGLLSGNPIMVTDGNFDDTVGKSPLPVLLFCWAPWCPTCGTVAPSMDEFASDAKGRVRVGKLNIDANPITASRFNVRSVPFLFIFDSGQLKESLPGGVPKHEIMMKMAHYL